MSKPRVLVMGTGSRQTVRETIDQLRPVIERHAAMTVQDLQCDSAIPAIPAIPDGGVALALVVGGDGSILKASRQLAPAGVPCLGVNVGRLGFLAGFRVEEVAEALPEVLAGGGRRVERMMLTACIDNGNGHCRRETALNDVVLSHGASYRMIAVTVDINGQSMATYHGDGVIVATPTGSTAYNLAAGGPILERSLEATVITPISPHMLTHRSIVIDSDSLITLRLNEQRESACIIDGQIHVPLVAGDVVRVEKSPQRLVMIDNPRRSSFETLREKLHWSHAPRYAGGQAPGAR